MCVIQFKYEFKFIKNGKHIGTVKQNKWFHAIRHEDSYTFFAFGEKLSIKEDFVYEYELNEFRSNLAVEKLALAERINSATLVEVSLNHSGEFILATIFTGEDVKIERNPFSYEYVKEMEIPTHIMYLGEDEKPIYHRFKNIPQELLEWKDLREDGYFLSMAML